METHETHPVSHHPSATMDPVIHFIKSKPIKIALCAVAGLVVLLLVFGAGIEIGFRKASHSFRWGENYHRNFGGPRGGFMEDFGRLGRGDYMDANGTVGQILKIDGQTIAIKGRDNVEKLILVDDKTSVRSASGIISLTELKPDDVIVAIGEPNEAGQIEAKFVRLMPPPAASGLPPLGQPFQPPFQPPAQPMPPATAPQTIVPPAQP